jgi:murein DD-endopeptidase MepM/ murein hydrolase activator NlpD
MHVYGALVKTGDTVKAGQLLAYHEVQADNAGHSAYEIAVDRVDTSAMTANAVRLVSMLTLLAPNVASAYSNVGITETNGIWSEEFRVVNPCFMKSRGLFIGPTNPADTVALKH